MISYLKTQSSYKTLIVGFIVLYFLDPKKQKHKIYWDYTSISLPFTGTPFMIAGRKEYDCHLGKDKNEKAKEKRAMKKAADNVNIIT